MYAKRAFVVACSLLLALVASVSWGQRAKRQPSPSAGQRQPGSVSVEEAVWLTNVWALLAEGRADQSVAKAEQAIAAYPRSAAVLEAAVEAHIAQAGAAGGLDRYERWLGPRTTEEPGVLRRIALALVREEAAQRQDVTAQAEAMLALADEGERSLADVAASGPAGTRALAIAGNTQAAAKLIADLGGNPADPVRIIEALGESRRPEAVAPIARYLGDQRQDVRGAAVSALGMIGDSKATEQVRPLLSDRSAFVRIRAAGALVRLGDDSGVAMLQQLMADQSPEMRLAAAEAMESRPDAGWLSVVRQLTEVSEPEIRAGAARLLAAREPESARAVFESLANSDNPAIRDLASRGLASVVTSDFAVLHRLFRNPQRLTRVRAAARLLALTR